MGKISKVRLFLILLTAEHTARILGGVLIIRAPVSEVLDTRHFVSSQVQDMATVGGPVPLFQISKLEVEQPWSHEAAHATKNPLEEARQSNALAGQRARRELLVAEAYRKLRLPYPSLAPKPAVGGEAPKYSYPPFPLKPATKEPFSFLETYVTLSLNGKVNQGAEEHAARALRVRLQASDSEALSKTRQDIHERLLNIFNGDEQSVKLRSTIITPEAWDATLNGLIAQFTKLGQPIGFVGFKEIENELQLTRIDGHLIIWFSRALFPPPGKSIKECDGPIAEGFQSVVSTAANAEEAMKRLLADFHYIDDTNSPHREEVLSNLATKLRLYYNGGYSKPSGT